MSRIFYAWQTLERNIFSLWENRFVWASSLSLSVIKMDPDQLTLRLGLSRLEREGGWCRELGVRTDRTSSSILYMLRSSDTTAWHRLAAVNEFWCHHQGANIRWGQGRFQREGFSIFQNSKENVPQFPLTPINYGILKEIFQKIFPDKNFQIFQIP